MFTSKALKMLIIPIFLDQVLIILVSIITTIMLSYAGEAAVSGVSLVDMINMLLINVLYALSAGGAVVVSQYIGRKDKENSCHSANQLITIAAVISAGIMLFVVIFHRLILHILFGNVEAGVMKTAITYFLISGLSYPFLSLYDSGASIFRSMGNSRIPMIISLMMNLINITGNVVSIFVLHKGVLGIAITALVARLFAAAIIINLLRNRNNEVYIHFSEILSWDANMIRRILKIAIPNGIENGIVQLGRVLLISIISMFGTSQIAANGITNGLAGMAIVFANAMNLSIITVVGQCVGAGDYQQAAYYAKKMIRIAYAGTIIICAIQTVLLNPILSLYTLSPGTHHLAYTLVVIHNLMAVLIWPLSFTLPSGLRAAGDVRFTMIFSIVSMFICRVTFAYILGVGLHLGVIGIWLAMGIDWAVRSMVYITRFKRGKWRNLQVI